MVGAPRNPFARVRGRNGRRLAFWTFLDHCWRHGVPVDLEQLDDTPLETGLQGGVDGGLCAVLSRAQHNVIVVFSLAKGMLMIKNERQYRITRSQTEKFAEALRTTQARSGGNALLRKVESDALRSQLEELQQELAAYEQLRTGRRRTITVDSFEDLPRALVQARIAAGLSQKELAQRLKLKEQQIQRYEASDYATASMARIRQVMQALGVTLRGKVAVAKD